MAPRSLPGDAVRVAALRGQAGFTYLGLLAAVAILGILLTMATQVWSFSEQRDRETQLLWVGDQYRMAIARYFAFGHQYPLTLQDLVTDKRFPVPRHYLRRLYPDPMTGAADWTLIMDPTNVGIMGVASQSKRKPIKHKSFDSIELDFEDQDCYCDWKFVYLPRRGNWLGAPLPGPDAPNGPGVNPGLPPGGTPSPAPGVPVPTSPGSGQ